MQEVLAPPPRPVYSSFTGSLIAAFCTAICLVCLTLAVVLAQAGDILNVLTKLKQIAEGQPLDSNGLSTHIIEAIDRVYWTFGAYVSLVIGTIIPFFVLYLLLHRTILSPLRHLSNAMARIVEGDHSVPIPFLQRIDEIGSMARRIEVFKRNAERIEREMAARRDLEAQLRVMWQAVENSPAAVVVTDSDGCIQYVNKKFSQLTEYTHAEAVGRKAGFHSAGNTPSEVYDNLWSTLKSGKEWRGEFFNRRKSGTPYWEHILIAPVPNENGVAHHFVAITEDITEKKNDEIRVWQKAHIDPLTALPNRMLFEDRLEEAIVRARKTDSLLALLYVDLDRFKLVNDTFGHEAGDELLFQVGARLQSCVRDRDTVCRVGGDEFLILLTDLDRDAEASNIANRITYVLNRPLQLAAGEATIGVSVGIAIFPRDGTTSALLVKNADVAMYWSKRAGRNTFRFFSQTPDEHLDYYCD